MQFSSPRRLSRLAWLLFASLPQLGCDAGTGESRDASSEDVWSDQTAPHDGSLSDSSNEEAASVVTDAPPLTPLDRCQTALNYPGSGCFATYAETITQEPDAAGPGETIFSGQCGTLLSYRRKTSAGELSCFFEASTGARNGFRFVSITREFCSNRSSVLEAGDIPTQCDLPLIADGGTLDDAAQETSSADADPSEEGEASADVDGSEAGIDASVID